MANAASGALASLLLFSTIAAAVLQGFSPSVVKLRGFEMKKAKVRRARRSASIVMARASTLLMAATLESVSDSQPGWVSFKLVG
ncbi:hypothetical protein AMELA_G00208130 [Ameiurus melas]|uniref:Uncharacterized protein n=1 Tax=Ameiurus melas TaxID=219545 RepID=A0A7J6A638_AMEME|nr:hypothetical protein AMELA_G00208130 [Ameiurus melas]